MSAKDTQVEIIRKTHRNLRRKLADGNDFDKVWKSHCANDRVLDEYSSAMETLATSVWDVDCDGKDRTKWCEEVCIEYYHNGGLKKLLEKDARRKLFYDDKKDSCFVRGSSFSQKSTGSFSNQPDPIFRFPERGKILLLDVGSCYNPFSACNEFETLAIDIAPANKDVCKCDFISVEIAETIQVHLIAESSKQENLSCLSSISKLPRNHYHVVVFSLLLSYIPCPHTRWLMCQKAHVLLCTNGLLLIVTPDSSHQNRHAALMKSWKNAIETIGFQRTKYAKDKHLHFLAFRKVPSDFVWDKRKHAISTSETLHIPQDFTDRDLHDPAKLANVDNNNTVISRQSLANDLSENEEVTSKDT